MNTAILIGFQYESEQYIHGIANDIEKMYEYCKLKFKTTVVTNISSLFFHSIPETNICFIFDSDSMKQKLSLLFDSKSHFFIYYTGHGTKNGIELPSNETVSLTKLLNSISYIPHRQTFLLLDCCFSGGLKLPFRLQNKVDSDFLGTLRNEILVLSATHHHQRSQSSKSGSFFTSTMLNQINKITSDSLQSFVDSVNFKLHGRCTEQKMMVMSNLPLPKKIWSWIYDSSFSLHLNKFAGYVLLKRNFI